MFEDASLGDLRMMFDGTLVRHNGEPVFIHHVADDKKAECLFIGNQEYKYITILDKGFDFTPVSLGYVNVRGQSIYASRNPLRRYKQGLSPECLNIFATGEDFDSEERYTDAQKQVKSLKSKCLYNTVKRVFPSLEDVIASFEDKVRMAAFDRQFALRYDGILKYRNNKVGRVDLNNGNVFLNKGKEYLISALGNKYEYR